MDWSPCACRYCAGEGARQRPERRRKHASEQRNGGQAVLRQGIAHAPRLSHTIAMLSFTVPSQLRAASPVSQRPPDALWPVMPVPGSHPSPHLAPARPPWYTCSRSISPIPLRVAAMPSHSLPALYHPHLGLLRRAQDMASWRTVFASLACCIGDIAAPPTGCPLVTMCGQMRPTMTVRVRCWPNLSAGRPPCPLPHASPVTGCSLVPSPFLVARERKTPHGFPLFALHARRPRGYGILRLAHHHVARADPTATFGITSTRHAIYAAYAIYAIYAARAVSAVAPRSPSVHSLPLLKVPANSGLAAWRAILAPSDTSTRCGREERASQ